MILAALFIGLLTAYYLGLRAGTAAAVGSFALFLLAAFLPATKVLVYIVVGAAVGTVCVIGPYQPPPRDAVNLRRVLSGLWRQVTSRLGGRNS
ncbi:hypothetical protein [Haliangium ochraceum]|uniref:Uncharacterized protein n=1 Tax=Haliangium ochraceum (strain DSM 14365 / JCM 11303 / SMP-2) TaxID=502025 RepID=D0LLX4_HALO1|nr:hypothetical protein [Haliangium ochraceum]ACY15152.1 hypothetical protein Hoch_2619 [Haliangium ochraceum DSM 14365]